MSFSTHRKAVLDSLQPLPHRASHARSCALHVAQKHNVKRESVIERIQEITGVSLHAPGTEAELLQAFNALQVLRSEGLAIRG